MPSRRPCRAIWRLPRHSAVLRRSGRSCKLSGCAPMGPWRRALSPASRPLRPQPMPRLRWQRLLPGCLPAARLAHPWGPVGQIARIARSQMRRRSRPGPVWAWRRRRPETPLFSARRDRHWPHRPESFLPVGKSSTIKRHTMHSIGMRRRMPWPMLKLRTPGGQTPIQSMRSFWPPQMPASPRGSCHRSYPACKTHRMRLSMPMTPNCPMDSRGLCSADLPWFLRPMF